MAGRDQLIAPPWRRRLTDATVVVVTELWSIADLVTSGRHHGENAGHHAGPTEWILAHLLVFPLIVRRRFPVGVLVATTVVGATQLLISHPSAADLAVLVALYTVAAERPRRESVAAAGVVEVGVLVASLKFQPVGDNIVASFVFLTGLAAAAYFLGTSVRARRQYLSSLEDRAQRLERERDQQAILAANAERTRIAREMHDIVAHSLAVVITLADGAAVTARADPHEAEQAMRQVGETGRQALAEMRRLLGVLRDERPASRAPQPGLGRLDELFGDVRAAGLPIEYTLVGTPLRLPPTAESAIYRIVQESLTNVIKHAQQPGLAKVRLHWSADGVRIEVSDDGAASGPLPVLFGHGLQGMRERAALYGGTLESGPLPERGWLVLADLRFESAVH